jgi:hypothetical protein
MISKEEGRKGRKIRYISRVEWGNGEAPNDMPRLPNHVSTTLPSVNVKAQLDASVNPAL